MVASKWRPLQPGEPIGVVALSGPVQPEQLAAGIGRLEAWGHPVLVAPNVSARFDYLAGDDDSRLAGLQWVLDQGARSIVAARGGYGVTRLLHRLPWQRLVRDQICITGYSDLTALLNPLATMAGAVQVHGPMVAGGLEPKVNRRRLHRLLRGDLQGKTLFRFSSRSVVRPGRCSGVMVGGTLTMFTALIGTGYEPDYRGAVLLLEEVNEPLYRLDRLLTHLRRSDSLSHVKAIVGGNLLGCRPFRERDRIWRRLLAEAVPDDAVVLAGLPFGHGARNMAFPIGAEVEIDTGAGTIVWSR